MGRRGPPCPRCAAVPERETIRDALVALSGPLDIAVTLEPLRRNDDLLDRWDGRVMRRTLRRATGDSFAYAALPQGDLKSPAFRVETGKRADLEIARHGAATSVLSAGPALARLAATDPVIATLARRHRGVGMVRHPDMFLALLRAISAQQVNLRWAATTRSRLATAFGERHVVAGGEVYSLDPARIAGLSVLDVRALQFTTRKAEYIIEAATTIAEGHLDTDQLRTLSDAEVVARLTALRGIGTWSAEWVLARTLGRPVCVAGDLGVRRVVAQAYLGVSVVDEATVRRLTAHWGDAAAAAQWLLFRAADAGDDLRALASELREGHLTDSTV